MAAILTNVTSFVTAADCPPDGWFFVQSGGDGGFRHRRELCVHLSVFRV